MKVKIANVIYDTAQSPIALFLTDEEKAKIMKSDKFICFHPEDYNEESLFTWLFNDSKL